MNSCAVAVAAKDNDGDDRWLSIVGEIVIVNLIQNTLNINENLICCINF